MEGGILYRHVFPFPVSSSNSLNSSITRRRRTVITAETEEIRVCTNRTCRRQGSMKVLETISAIVPPTVRVNPCGCLGRCGAGPNLVSLPEGTIIRHCGTVARAAEVMLALCGGGRDSAALANVLDALALTKRAQKDIDSGNFSNAEILISQAIGLNQFGGVHMMYKDRSIARLAMGNHSGALEDANQALALAPHFAQAYICQGDVFLTMEQYDLAENSYSTCIDIEPSIRRSKSFKTRILKLQEKLAALKN